MFKKKTTPLLVKSNTERTLIQLGKKATLEVAEMIISNVIREITFSGILFIWEKEGNFNLIYFTLTTCIFADMEGIIQLCHQTSITVPISGL